MPKEFEEYLEETKEDAFVVFLKENKKTVQNIWRDLYDQTVIEVVQSYDWEEEDHENEDEWYSDYGYTTGHQAEYDTAEYVLRELKRKHGLSEIDSRNEDLQTKLIDFMGYEY